MLINRLTSVKVYLLFFHSGMAILVGFLPVYLKSLGLSGKEVGWLVAIGPLAGILSQPLWGYISDKYRTVKKLLLIAIAFTIVNSIILFKLDTFTALLWMMFIFFFFLSPAIALGDSLSQRISSNMKVSFGSIRMWGSVGFAFTALITGYIYSAIGVKNILGPFLFCIVIAFLLGFTLTDVKSEQKPAKLIEALKIVANMRFSIFLLIIFFISLTHRANDNFLGIFIQELGGQESLIGWAWFVGVLTEALVFALGFLLIGRFSELTLITIAGITYALRFFIFSVISDPLVIIYLQVLHGISFALIYMSAFQYVSKIVPAYLQSTGHLVFVSVFFGVAGIIGSLLGGFVIDQAGGQVLYRYLTYIALLGTLGMVFYQRYIHLDNEGFSRYN